MNSSTFVEDATSVKAELAALRIVLVQTVELLSAKDPSIKRDLVGVLGRRLSELRRTRPAFQVVTPATIPVESIDLALSHLLSELSNPV